MPRMGYDAFISYSHAGDAKVAAAVEQGLERMARPWYRLHAISVFRDQSDLALTPHLWSTIEATLDESRFFVVLASPESAASTWVNREVSHWCDRRGTEALLLVVTGGEIAWDDARGGFSAASTAVPDALRTRFTEEPLWVDLRWARDADELSLHLTRFRDPIAQLASRIHGIPKDELEGEDARLHRRARRLARGAVATLAALGLVAAAAAVVAIRNAHRADQRTREAIARQVGLEALDEPASALDRALLLSLAAGDLDTGTGADRFRSARTLIGRYARLDAILETGTQAAVTSIRSLAFSSNGSSLAASVLSSDAHNRTTTTAVRWSALGGAGRPTRTSSVAPAGPMAYVGTSNAIAIGGPGEVSNVLPATGPPRRFAGQAVVAARSDRDRAVVSVGDRHELVAMTTGAVLASEPAGPTAAVLGADVAVFRRGSTVVVRSLSDGQQLASAPLTSDPTAGTAVSPTSSPAKSPASTPAKSSVMAVTPAGTVVEYVSDSPGGLRLQRFERQGGALISRAPVGVTGSSVAHDELVQALLSPDGSHLLVLTRAGAVMLDARSGATSAEDRAPAGPTAADQSGRYVAVGGAGLDVWDLQLGQRVLAVPDPVNAVAWARSTPRLVTVGRSLDVWDVASPRHVQLAEGTNAQTVAIAPDGASIASAGWGASVSVWRMDPTADDVGREALIRAATGGGEPAVAYDPGTRIVAQLAGGSLETVLSGSEAPPGARLSLLAAGTRALVRPLVPEAAAVVGLWDVGTGRPVRLDPSCRSDLVEASADGALFASFRTADRLLAVCDGHSGRLLSASRVGASLMPVTALAVAGDGEVALGGGHGIVARFPRAGDRFGAGVALDARLGGQPVTVTSVAIGAERIVAGLSSDSGGSETTAPGNGRVLVWDRSGSEPVVFDVDQPRVPAVGVFGPDDGVLVFATQIEDGGPVQLQVAESSTRRQLGRPLTGLSGTVTQLAADTGAGGTAEDDVIAVVGVDAGGRAFRWPIARDPSREVCAIVGRSLTRQEWDAAAAGKLAAGDFRGECPDG
jgi:hypothetical protein